MGKASNIIDKFISTKTMGILGAAGGFMAGGQGWGGITSSITNAIGGNIHGLTIEELTNVIGSSVPYGVIAMLAHFLAPALPGGLKKYARIAGAFSAGLGIGNLGGRMLHATTHSGAGAPGQMANFGSTGTPYARIPGPYGGVQYTQRLKIPPVSRVPHLATRLAASPKPGK